MNRVLALTLLVLLAGCGGSGTPLQRSSADEAAAYNLQLGVAYLQQGNLQLAKEKIERAQMQNPRDPNVQMALALLHERLGDVRRADAHYRSALRLAPRNPDIANNYAVYLCRNGRTQEGVDRFLDAARNPLYRTPEAAYTNAGVCLRSAQRLDEAEHNLLQALRVRPNFAEAAFQLGDLDLQRGRAREARARLDQYLGSFAATPELLLLGVRASRELGDRLAAERFARRLRMDFPDSAQTRALSELSRNPG
jgi:type IV pilus assembly protein PilF